MFFSFPCRRRIRRCSHLRLVRCCWQAGSLPLVARMRLPASRGVRDTHVSGKCHGRKWSHPHSCGAGSATGRGAQSSPRPCPRIRAGSRCARGGSQSSASITIQFKNTGGEITKLPDFGVTVYGTTLALSRNTLAPSFDPVLQQILVPANVAQATFSIANDLSTLLELSGSAPITSGAWALPVMTVLPAPDAVLGAGNVEIAYGAGIGAKWAGNSQTAAAQTAAIHASPGQIGVVLHLQTQPFVETFQLWQEAGGARNSSVEFDYPRSSRFSIARSSARKRCRSAARQTLIWIARCGLTERAFRSVFRPARRRSCSPQVDCN